MDIGDHEQEGLWFPQRGVEFGRVWSFCIDEDEALENNANGSGIDEKGFISDKDSFLLLAPVSASMSSENGDQG